MAHHNTRSAQLPVENVNTFHTWLFHHNIWDTFSCNVKNLLGMFMNCRISQRVISVIPSRAHHHLGFVFSLCSFIFTILHYFSSFLCEPSKCFSTWWMIAQTSILSFSQMSVLCTNFLSPERSAFMFCWDGSLQWVWWKNCSTMKQIYIRNFLCQFDMSNFSLTSIKSYCWNQ